MKQFLKHFYYQTVIVFLLVLTVSQFSFAQNAQNDSKAQKEAKKNQELGLGILDEMKEILKENYYDPNFHGINLDARFKAAKERIKTLTYNWEIMRVLAQVLLDFDDSHTRFQPPPRTDAFQYGFSLQMMGHDCFVTDVKKDSDAEKKGLKVGDQILAIGKFAPSRQNLWKILYVIYRLDPNDLIDLKIKRPNGEEAQLIVKAKTMSRKEQKEELQRIKERRKKENKDDELNSYKCHEISTDVIACKLFTFVTEKNQIDKMMKQIRPHKKLILDLRGNGGGYVLVEEYLLGHFFDHDVKIADMITRGDKKERFAKSQGDKVFKGEVIVLVDSNSASAAEITARVLQLEKRALIIGDVTSGSVMTSISRGFFSPASAFAVLVIAYSGMSVTIADVIMKDGSRLEKVGVVPDIPVIPTAQSLANKEDALLAYSLSLFGEKTTPQEAGKFYFMLPKPEEETAGEDEPEKN